MKPSFFIDCFAENGLHRNAACTVVAIDVIRATSVAITAAANGWRCFPVSSLPEAQRLAGRFSNALLMGELAGETPASFEMNNSPAELEARTDSYRPIVLLSSNGTKLIAESKATAVTYLACLRNFRAAAHQLMDTHERVAIIGAGSRGEFREEDQMCCAWIGELLLQHGYVAENSKTVEMVSKWSGAPASALISSKSVDYLRRTGQLHDLEYIVNHIDDLRSAYVMDGDEVIEVDGTSLVSVTSMSAIPIPAKVA